MPAASTIKHSTSRNFDSKTAKVVKRVKGKIKQKTIANLGRVDKALIAEKVDSLIESISRYSSRQETIDICNDITPLSSKTFGEITVFRKLWEELGLNKVFSKYFKKTKKEIDLVEAIFALVCNRLIAPSSKREADKWKAEVYEPKWDKLELHHLYRALDFLQENKVIFSSAKDWMIRNGYRRYLNIKEMRIEIDHEKLEAEKQHNFAKDGFDFDI